MIANFASLPKPWYARLKKSRTISRTRTPR